MNAVHDQPPSGALPTKRRFAARPPKPNACPPQAPAQEERLWQTRPHGAPSVTTRPPGQAPKLLDQMSNVLRTGHYCLRTMQELLRHADLNTTMIYTYVVNKGPLGVKSPADLL